VAKTVRGGACGPADRIFPASTPVRQGRNRWPDPHRARRLHAGDKPDLGATVVERFRTKLLTEKLLGMMQIVRHHVFEQHAKTARAARSASQRPSGPAPIIATVSDNCRVTWPRGGRHVFALGLACCRCSPLGRALQRKEWDSASTGAG